MYFRVASRLASYPTNISAMILDRLEKFVKLFRYKPLKSFIEKIWSLKVLNKIVQHGNIVPIVPKLNASKLVVKRNP